MIRLEVATKNHIEQAVVSCKDLHKGEVFCPSPNCHAFVNGDKVVALVDLQFIAPGVASLTAVVTNHVYECRVDFARSCVESLDYLINLYGLRRIGMDVRASSKEAIRFAKFLGFTHEGTHKNFYEDGESLLSFGRVR